MTTHVDADVVVIGMGPGGEDVAGRLAQAGLDVVGIEQDLVGGECPYWGCVPSKMMLRAAHLLAEARRVRGMAGDAVVRPDWGPVAKRIREEATDSWDDQVAVERFEGKGGRLLRGRGRVVGPGAVAVGDHQVRARHGMVIATGTSTAVPPVPGLEQVPYWTNREAVETEDLPTSLVVLGGGAVGVELAQVFARFGVDVTVVEALARLVPTEEPEVGPVLADVLAGDGVDVRVGIQATEVHRDGARVAVELEDGATVAAAKLLVATGRRADLASIGLGSVGVDQSQRWLPVDERLRVIDGVWGVGDVTGKGPFTHVALYQSPIAVADILGEEVPPADYRAVPHVTFTDPEIGAVGLSEADARQAAIDVRVGVARVPETARGWIHRSGNEGLIKLVADANRGVLVGATAMGPSGGEVTGLLALALHAEVPVEHLRRMIYTYPTFHRGVEDALRNLDA